MALPTRRTLLVLLAAAAVGCAARPPDPAEPASSAVSSVDACAERYVKLALALGQHDANYVDAYYGPPAWADEAKAAAVPLAEIASRSAALVRDIEAVPAPADKLVAQRRRFLRQQAGALAARVRLLRGERLSFDDESEALYNARAPVYDDAHFERLQAELDRLLPGSGPLTDRIDRFRQGFVIPQEKLDVVFRTALAEARRRTLAHIVLPAEESVSIEFVTGKTWGGYNWYKGNAKSLVQINTDLPIFIRRAIDLAAHEGYPGHHVYNVLLEQHLMRARGWIEFSVYPLFSPQSLIAEGSANYGVDVAFPDGPTYLREVLFPLAGLDPQGAALYVRVEDLAGALSYASNEAARGYLDGRLTREQARDWLARYGLMSPVRAERLMSNIEVTRTYVINYNLGRDLVAAYIERQGGTAEAPERRWRLFEQLLSSPLLPGDLR
jgi:hypothetical protein